VSLPGRSRPGFFDFGSLPLHLGDGINWGECSLTIEKEVDSVDPAQTSFLDAGDFVVRIEWPRAGGYVQKTAFDWTSDDMLRASRRALDTAVATIQTMAHRTATAVRDLPKAVCPEEAEIEFGITLDAEAGALVAKASSGAQITVKLKWTRGTGPETPQGPA
jgi:hypothetical protein